MMGDFYSREVRSAPQPATGREVKLKPGWLEIQIEETKSEIAKWPKEWLEGSQPMTTDPEKFICDAAFENWWSSLRLPHIGRRSYNNYRYINADVLADKWQARAVWQACWEANNEIRRRSDLNESIESERDFSDALKRSITP